jgi:actin-like ATPase involved in cell morphogenesis
MMRIRGSVAIDLGTVNTLIWVTGRGIVLDEPSTIAINSANGAIVAIGSAAESLSEKEPQEISVIHPLRDGVIADLEATAEMLHGLSACRAEPPGWNAGRWRRRSRRAAGTRWS